MGDSLSKNQKTPRRIQTSNYVSIHRVYTDVRVSVQQIIYPVHTELLAFHLTHFGHCSVGL